MRSPWRAQQRGGEPGGRGLAVGPDHVDRAEATPAASRAPSSGGASGPARSACRTARGRAGRPRPARRSWAGRGRSQRLQLGPQALELVALGGHHVRRAPWPRSPGWRACPRRARSPGAASRAAARGAARPRRGRSRRTPGPRPCRRGRPRVAAGSPPLADSSSRASRATSAGRLLVARGVEPRREERAGLDLGVVAPRRARSSRRRSRPRSPPRPPGRAGPRRPTGCARPPASPCSPSPAPA